MVEKKYLLCTEYLSLKGGKNSFAVKKINIIKKRQSGIFIGKYGISQRYIVFKYIVGVVL